MKLLNVPEGHKKSKAFFRVSEKGVGKTKFFQKKYLIIALILSLLFISGCRLAKPEKARYYPSPSPIEPSVTVRRDINCRTNTVNLDISTSGLDDNEIIVIVDRIPYGTGLVEDSWSKPYSFVDEDTIVWIFAKNPPQTLGGKKISEPIPTKIIYQVSEEPKSEFRGKWSLKTLDRDGLIIGESSC